MKTFIENDCDRCGHAGRWHSLDESLNVGPTDPDARFSCNGVNFEGCSDRCPDFQGESITIIAGV